MFEILLLFILKQVDIEFYLGIDGDREIIDDSLLLLRLSTGTILPVAKFFQSGKLFFQILL